MVFNVRCFKCGQPEVRLVLGGRSIIHAQCHGCETNLLAEVMKFEQEVAAGRATHSAAEDEGYEESPPAASSAPTPETYDEGIAASSQ